MGPCIYSFDSKEWEADHDVEVSDHWTWECPYDQFSKEHDHCLFHMPPAAREEADVSQDELRDRFVAEVLRGEAELHGADIPELHLDFLSLKNKVDQPIYLRANRFAELSFANTQISTAIFLDYSVIKTLDVSHAVFHHALGIQRAVIGDAFEARMADLDRAYAEGLTVATCDLTESDIKRIALVKADIKEFQCRYAQLSVMFDQVTVSEDFAVENAIFEKLVDCRDATFDCPCKIHKAEFRDNLRMEESSFHEGVEFKDSTLAGVSLAHADVYDDLRFSDSVIDTVVLDAATIDGELRVNGTFEDTFRAHQTTCPDEVWFSDITTDDLSVSKLNTDELFISADQVDDIHIMSSNISTLHISDGDYGTIGLSDSVIKDLSLIGSVVDTLLLVKSTINGDEQENQIGDATLQNVELRRIDWRGSPINQCSTISFISGSVDTGNLHQPEKETFEFVFYRTTIGGVDFENIGGNDLQHAHFIEPDFDQFPFENYAAELAPRWRFNHGESVDFPESNIGPLEKFHTYQSARASAEASNQEDARAGLYKREMRSQTHVLMQRWQDDRDYRSLMKWFELRLLDGICGYGEDPSRPVLIALGTIGVFAVIYAGMLYSTDATAKESLLTGVTLSLQAFATLVFNPDPEFSGLLGRFLTSLEGVVATLLIPFLVFALTRSID